MTIMMTKAMMTATMTIMISDHWLGRMLDLCRTSDKPMFARQSGLRIYLNGSSLLQLGGKWLLQSSRPRSIRFNLGSLLLKNWTTTKPIASRAVEIGAAVTRIPRLRLRLLLPVLVLQGRDPKEEQSKRLMTQILGSPRRSKRSFMPAKQWKKRELSSLLSEREDGKQWRGVN